MKIIITQNYAYGLVEAVFQGKEIKLMFDYVFKNGTETEILCSNDKEYWYLKALYVEKNDIDDVVSVEVEDVIYTDCTFYQIIDENTQKVLDYNASYEDVEKIKENLSKENKFLKEISKEQFSEHWKSENNDL